MKVESHAERLVIQKACAMTRLNDISIRRKFSISLGISILFICALIAIGVMNMLAMKRASEGLYLKSSGKSAIFLKLSYGLMDARRAVLDMLSDPSRKGLSSHIAAVDDASRAVDEAIEMLLSNKNELDADEVSAIEGIRPLWAGFKATRDKEIIPAIRAGDYGKAANTAATVQKVRFDEIKAVSDMLIEHERLETADTHGLMEKRLGSSIIWYAVISALGIASAVLSLSYLSVNTVRRLQTVWQGLKKVEAGELGFGIEDRGKDEIGGMAESFNKMSAQLYEDRINQEQAAANLKWLAEESAERAVDYASLNNALLGTQKELVEKNVRLEQTLADMKKMNGELADARSKMTQSEKMASLGVLSAGVAHEINNPIGFVNSNFNSLASYTDIFAELYRLDAGLYAALKEGDIAKAGDALERIEAYKKEVDSDFAVDDIKELIKESKDGIGRVVRIVTSLKEFSHAGAGDKAECDINKCIENTITLCWNQIKYKAELVREFGELPPVWCNQHKMGQVFMNIIVNAAHAITDHGVIRIKTCADGENAVIRISDNGVGIPDYVMKRLFEPFFTTKPVGIGTGLGLSIVYGIVKEHNGSIEIQSRPFEETTFTISIPLFEKHGGAASEEVVHYVV